MTIISRDHVVTYCRRVPTAAAIHIPNTSSTYQGLDIFDGSRVQCFIRDGIAEIFDKAQEVPVAPPEEEIGRGALFVCLVFATVDIEDKVRCSIF